MGADHTLQVGSTGGDATWGVKSVGGNSHQGVEGGGRANWGMEDVEETRLGWEGMGRHSSGDFQRETGQGWRGWGWWGWGEIGQSVGVDSPGREWRAEGGMDGGD